MTEPTRTEPETPPEASAPPPPVVDEAMQRFAARLKMLTPRVYVVHALLVLNVGVFVAMLASGVHFMEPKNEDIFAWGANFGPLTLGGDWWRLLSCAFVHAGILHLALNMFSLWAVGRVVERLLGTGPFVVMYLASALAGSLASILWNPWALSVGASGALFGIFGALAAFALVLRKEVPQTFLKSVVRDVAFILLVNVVYSFTAKGIDIAAHFGGLAGGFLTSLLLVVPLDERAAKARRVRAAIVAVLAAAGTAAAVLLVPSGARETLAVLEAVDQEESRAIAAYNAIVVKAKERSITDHGFADALEKDVLDAWRKTRARLDGIEDRNLTSRLRPRVVALRRYMTMREQAWSQLAQALRAKDSEAVKRAMEQSREAERVMREFQASEPK